MKKIIKDILEILGYSCFFAFAFTLVLMFLDILFKGIFIAKEPNFFILILEIFLVFYGLVFATYKVISFLKEE